jgi:hypothetical protein
VALRQPPPRLAQHTHYRHEPACQAFVPACPRASVQLGGMGFVHYNNTAEEQLRQVQKAKSFTPGFVVTPATAAPSDTVSKLLELKVRPPFAWHAHAHM